MRKDINKMFRNNSLWFQIIIKTEVAPKQVSNHHSIGKTNFNMILQDSPTSFSTVFILTQLQFPNIPQKLLQIEHIPIIQFLHNQGMCQHG